MLFRIKNVSWLCRVAPRRVHHEHRPESPRAAPRRPSNRIQYRLESPRTPFIPARAGWTGQPIPAAGRASRFLRLDESADPQRPDGPTSCNSGKPHPPQPIALLAPLTSFAGLGCSSTGRRSCSLRCPRKSPASGRFLGSEKSEISRDAVAGASAPATRGIFDPSLAARSALVRFAHENLARALLARATATAI